LGTIQRHGLLDEDVLAGAERKQDVLVVQVVRRGDVDHVETRVRHQRLVAAVGGRDLPLVCEGVRLVLCSGTDGGDVLPRVRFMADAVRRSSR
jgi:hypothetical protein